MKALAPLLTAFLLASAGPVLAGERGGCAGGCGGYPGRNINVNVNAAAQAHAYATSRTSIDARAYEVGSVGPGRPIHGGAVNVNGGAPVEYEYGYGVVGHGPVRVLGPGYGPSRPFGYEARGFGRRYAAFAPWNSRYPAHPPCDCRDVRHGHSEPYPSEGGYGYADYDARARGGATYRAYESYSETSAYASGYAEDRRHAYSDDGYDRRDRDRRDDGPRYAPIPYYAAPLEPVPYARDYEQPEYAPPPVVYAPPVEEPPYAPPPPPPPPPLGYYGDLPPGDTGQGIPYRQEPGERG